MADNDFVKVFSRSGNEAYVPDPRAVIVRNRVQDRQTQYTERIKEILVEAAIRGEETMKNLAPVNTGELKKSIEIYPSVGKGVMSKKGGSGMGVGPGGVIGFGRGGVSRSIEVRIGGPRAPYAPAVVGGSSKAPKEGGPGRYVVFSPYTVGAKSIVFKKNRININGKEKKLYEDRVGVTYGPKNFKKNKGVLIFNYRAPIPENDYFVVQGVRRANNYVSRTLKNLNS